MTFSFTRYGLLIVYDKKASKILDDKLATVKREKKHKKSETISTMLSPEEVDLINALRNATKDEQDNFKDSLADIFDSKRKSMMA